MSWRTVEKYVLLVKQMSLSLSTLSLLSVAVVRDGDEEREGRAMEKMSSRDGFREWRRLLKNVADTLHVDF